MSAQYEYSSENHIIFLQKNMSPNTSHSHDKTLWQTNTRTRYHWFHHTSGLLAKFQILLYGRQWNKLKTNCKLWENEQISFSIKYSCHRTGPVQQCINSSGSKHSACYTIPLHCRDEYTTSSPISSPLSLVSCGEQSNTVFFTLDPSLAIARISQRGIFSSIGKHRAMKWAWKRSGSPEGKGKIAC